MHFLSLNEIGPAACDGQFGRLKEPESARVNTAVKRSVQQ